jgi:hypothetical protein
LFANGRKGTNMTVHEDYGPYKVHLLADALPLIEGEEFDQDRSASPRRRSAKSRGRTSTHRVLA